MKPLSSLHHFLRKILSPARRKILIVAVCVLVALSVTSLTSAQKSATPIGTTKSSSTTKAPTPKARRNENKAAAQQSPLTTSVPISGQGIRETVADIMARQKQAEKQGQVKPGQIIVQPEPQEYEEPELPPDPNAPQGSQYPPLKAGESPVGTLNPQIVGTSFLGAQLSEAPFLPPDSNGDIGSTQVVVCANGRIKTFTKSTGVADGALNADTNTFFNSVRNGSGTSDPRVKYDRLSQRWFIVMINTAGTSNRCMIAVSSSSTITSIANFTFFQFVPDTGNFSDYPTLGIDKFALYIGYNIFNSSNQMIRSDGSVLNKANLLSGTLSGTTFLNLVSASASAILTPQGVDNDDPAATEGYFAASNGPQLSIIRVNNPSGSPTLTALTDIAINTATAIFVPAQGSTLPLDSLNRRLYAARLHKNKITGASTLWTAHNIQVDSTGTPNAAGGRMASRWYEVTGLTTATPSIVQMGTVFDSAISNPRNFWIPSVMMSGQGHMALGCSFAGNNDQAGIAVTGRLRSDTLGTTQAITLAQLGGGTYNVATNPPPVNSQRWGDYSIISVDPNDDQTLWAFQEYCNSNNSWAVRVLQLKAPPPATPLSITPLAPTAGCVTQGQTRNVQVDGVSVSGSEFFDPGADTGGPGYPNHVQVSVSGTGVTVNSVTFNNPTRLTINVTVTAGATIGARDLTVTNPDGQTATGVGIFCIQAPTEIKLDAFRANGYNDGRVLLQWQTGREADNLGFNIYREENGLRAKITPTLIAGSALLAGKGVAIESGQAYSWSDAPQSYNARYWLEDIDLSGKSAWHGPFTIASAKGSYPNQQNSDLLSRLNGRLAYLNSQGSAPLQRSASIASASLSPTSSNPLASQSAWKISVSREGWYRISQRQLAAAGFDASIDPHRLQLFADGQELAVTVAGESDGRFDADDYIEFYGLGVDTPATNTHVYWLTVGNQPGRRIQTSISKPSPSLSDSYAATVERRDHSIYFASLKNGDAENFFGVVVSATPVDQTLTVRNINRKAATATLEVSLQGVSQSPHQVAMALNGTSIGKLEFSDQTQGVARLQVPVTLLRDGENVVNLSAQNGATDVSLVAAIRITYQHSYVAENNSLRFTAAAGQSVTVSGFSNTSARIFDVTDPNNVQEVRGMVTGGGISSVTVTPQGAGQRVLLALTSERADSPDAITPNNISNWRSANSGADLVILTRRDFSEALASLKALRESQGLSVAVVDIEDIYDEFNFGTKSVQAVKDFFAYAKANWKQTPRFVLLAGDASFDPRNYLGFGDSDIVPTRLLDTAYLEAGSDDWLVDFDADGIGDIAIGRLPARSLAELATMTAKIVRYEKTGSNREALLVSDNNDGFNFDAANAQLKPLLPSDLHVTELQRSLLGEETRNRLLAALNAGAKIVNYAGHGSVTMWRSSLLTADDVQSLTNDQTLSVFVTMTCLNGYFDNAAGVSLAASLMKARGGAVAVWSSTALTLPSEQTAMNQEFYRALFNQNNATLGEAVRRAKAATDSADVRRSWIFFGDPAMRLR